MKPEYDVQIRDRGDMQRNLNALADEGWRLVTVTQTSRVDQYLVVMFHDGKEKPPN